MTMTKVVNRTNKFTYSIYQVIPLTLAVLVNAEERIIKDIKVVQSYAGVPIDFSYNQSTSEVQWGLYSAPGCPRSIDGYPWIYYGDPPRCHLAGYQGPCPKQMSLYLQAGSSFGICNCDCFKHENGVVQDSADGNYKLCEYNSQSYPEGGAFNKKAKICHPFGQQGPCDKGQWLVMSGDKSKVTCVPECPPDPQKYYDSKNNECKDKQYSGSSEGSALNPQDCVPPKVYSTVWKGCIDGPGNFLFLN